MFVCITYNVNGYSDPESEMLITVGTVTAQKCSPDKLEWN